MWLRSALLGLIACGVLCAQPSKETPGNQIEMLKGVAFDQRLNNQLPLDIPFRAHEGKQVMLREYFKDKPVIVVPVYYECPMLCNLSMAGLVKAMKVLTKLNPGRDFEVVMFSFDPKDTPAKASDKRDAYIKRYNRPGTESGWHFLSGEQSSIEALTSAMGFKYVYDKSIQQYAHAAGIVVATPTGKLSRYLFGMDYSAKDLRLGLVESANGKIGDPVAQLLLMCFHYDPARGQYTMNVLTVVRVGGILTLAAMGLFVVASLRKERQG